MEIPMMKIPTIKVPLATLHRVRGGIEVWQPEPKSTKRIMEAALSGESCTIQFRIIDVTTHPMGDIIATLMPISGMKFEEEV